MYRYSLTIPRAYNSGARVESTVLESFETEMLDTFGGFTAQDARGGWRDGDTTIVEPVTVYTLDSDSDSWADVEIIARTVADALAQDCVYVTETAPDGAQRRAFVESALLTV